MHPTGTAPWRRASVTAGPARNLGDSMTHADNSDNRTGPAPAEPDK